MSWATGILQAIGTGAAAAGSAVGTGALTGAKAMLGNPTAGASIGASMGRMLGGGGFDSAMKGAALGGKVSQGLGMVTQPLGQMALHSQGSPPPSMMVAPNQQKQQSSPMGIQPIASRFRYGFDQNGFMTRLR